MVDDKVARLEELIERIMRAATRLVRIDCNDIELTPEQTFVLRLLDTHGPMTVGDLRRAASAAQSTTSEMVGRLARAGYVHKRTDPADRRAVKVAISANGRAILAARLRDMRRRHKALLQALAADDQDRLVGAFEVITELMDRAAGNATHGDDDDA